MVDLKEFNEIIITINPWIDDICKDGMVSKLLIGAVKNTDAFKRITASRPTITMFINHLDNKLGKEQTNLILAKLGVMR